MSDAETDEQRHQRLGLELDYWVSLIQNLGATGAASTIRPRLAELDNDDLKTLVILGAYTLANVQKELAELQPEITAIAEELERRGHA